MLTILHGEHHLQSRRVLTQTLASAQNAGRQIAHVEVKNLESAALRISVQTQSLFAEPRTIIIEELHSLMKSKRKEELIKTIVEFADLDDVELVLWEKKQLTATELRQFPRATVQAFLPTRSMFTWLNALSGQQHDAVKARMLSLQRNAVDSDGEQFCFAMVMRQVRMLMEAKEGQGAAGQNFKMVAQAKLFTWSQLFFIHKQLLHIDLMQKTSGSSFSISSQLELLAVAM